MKLTDEQAALLAGERGEATALAMKTIVEYGRAFRAARLVPIRSAHLAGSFGLYLYHAYYRVLERLLAEGAKTVVPTTINPDPGSRLNLINRTLFRRQSTIRRMVRGLGVIPNYSCVCYDGANVPARGDVVGWAESSAVQYANSVLGARTNRNSVLVDVCMAVTGFAPEFGYLLDENRRGRILVRHRIDRMDAAALGFLIGRKLVDRVPVIEHYPFSTIELKNMGGAMAAAGGVAMFHVEGLTPEAPDRRTALDGEPETVLTITQSDLDALCSASRDRSADLVVFGCPQMTYDEARALLQRFDGRRAARPVWFCLIPEALERFRREDLAARAARAGIALHDHCPVAALTVRLRHRRVLTSSGKLFYYLAGSHYGTEQQCLRACGVGP